MHMDVTVMDRRQRLSGERPGHIFHSPDTGSAYRVDSNPWGFTGWFRTQVGTGERLFEQRLKAARDPAGVSRLIVLDEAGRRSEERRVGQDGVRRVKTRGSPY